MTGHRVSTNKTRSVARTSLSLVGALGLAAIVAFGRPIALHAQDPDVVPASAGLVPTKHQAVVRDLSRLWLVPRQSSPDAVRLAVLGEGVRLYQAANYAAALARFTDRSLAADSTLGDYATYYAALARFRIGRTDEARALLAALVDRRPVGYLAEAAALALGEIAATQADYATAARIYEGLTKQKPAAPDYVLLQLAKAARAEGDAERAARAYLTIYYSYPLGDYAAEAGTALEELSNVAAVGESAARFKLELGRAERLFGSRRYPQAQAAFEALRDQASGDDRELVTIRLAECDLYQQRHHKALDGLKPYLEHASRQAEAFFFYTSATRQLGNHDEYVRLSRQLVERFPESTWAEDALNNLATHFIVNNEDEQADQVFRDVLARFPTGRYAERAAWKAGWWAYKHARYQETIRIFEQASGAFPRSDYRPAFLYWSGRAYEAVGDRTAAAARLALVVTDYRNSYYGRLAARGAPAPRERTAAAVADAAAEGAETDGTFDLPPNAAQIRALIGLELYDQALDEVTCASRTYGPSPVLVATEAWLQNKRGDLRRGITLMKRAYPQYLTDGGEHLPHEILEVIFPVDHWPAIQQRAKARGLDPYLVAALIAQESTFVPDIRSSANAIGLMQVLPSTGRRYARRLGIRRFTPALLTRPDVNLRLGVAIFADLVKRFGGVHLALASYNAGESRVVKWIAERPGIERDEFIDDIPFPETQNYVKRILGTAEDYRAIYGSAGATSRGTSKTPAAVRTGAAPQPKPKPTRKPPAARGKRPTSQAPSN